MSSMKTLYSSTFLSIVLAFLVLLGQTGEPVTIVQDGTTASFQTIIEPIGPNFIDPSEKVKIEVFNTFGCQECDNFGLGTFPSLQQKYSENKKVDLHLYLVPDLENESELYATRGAHCAVKYNKFLEMTFKLHSIEELNKREVDLMGQDMDFPIIEFRNCIQGEEFDQQIGEDIAYSQQKNIKQKPTILVNDTIMLGSQPLENIDREINKYLNY